MLSWPRRDRSMHPHGQVLFSKESGVSVLPCAHRIACCPCCCCRCCCCPCCCCLLLLLLLLPLLLLPAAAAAPAAAAPAAATADYADDSVAAKLLMLLLAAPTLILIATLAAKLLIGVCMHLYVADLYCSEIRHAPIVVCRVLYFRLPHVFFRAVHRLDLVSALSYGCYQVPGTQYVFLISILVVLFVITCSVRTAIICIAPFNDSHRCLVGIVQRFLVYNIVNASMLNTTTFMMCVLIDTHIVIKSVGACPPEAIASLSLRCVPLIAAQSLSLIHI